MTTDQFFGSIKVLFMILSMENALLKSKVWNWSPNGPTVMPPKLIEGNSNTSVEI
jgi:hypothetical protein